MGMKPPSSISIDWSNTSSIIPRIPPLGSMLVGFAARLQEGDRTYPSRQRTRTPASFGLNVTLNGRLVHDSRLGWNGQYVIS